MLKESKLGRGKRKEERVSAARGDKQGLKNTLKSLSRVSSPWAERWPTRLGKHVPDRLL